MEKAGVFSNWERGIFTGDLRMITDVKCEGDLAGGDFGGGGWDLREGGVDVLGFDGGGGGTSSDEPCGLGEEVEGSGIAGACFGKKVECGGSDNVTLESGTTDLPLEVGGDGFAGQRLEVEGCADAREQRALDGKAHAFEQVFIAAKNEGEGGALLAAEAKEHADFIEGWGGVVLGIIEHEHEGDGVHVGEMFFQ